MVTAQQPSSMGVFPAGMIIPKTSAELAGGFPPDLHQDGFGIVGIKEIEFLGDIDLGETILDVDRALLVFQPFYHFFHLVLVQCCGLLGFAKGSLGYQPQKNESGDFSFHGWVAINGSLIPDK